MREEMLFGAIVLFCLIIWHDHDGVYTPVPTPEAAVDTPSVSLPDRCRELYDDGTGQWAICMGVGPK